MILPQADVRERHETLVRAPAGLVLEVARHFDLQSVPLVRDHVKIAWTLEAEGIGPALTRFATETRAAGTDEQARVKFRRYWRGTGLGIVAIRRLLLPALRREAERRWRAGRTPAP